MKILIVMDPGILVPPKGYGGIERLVETFAKEYKVMGHEVHLLVTTGSNVEGCVMYPFGKEGFPPLKADARKALPTAWKFLWGIRNDFDLVHNFGRLAYLIPILNHPVKKIMTYQREISDRNIKLINLLQSKNMYFTACSADLLSRIKAAGSWKVVYNAIHFSKYDVRPAVESDAPLIFLGRIERVKGCHIAIQLARQTGNKLIIAGNISPLAEEIEYFEKEIKPHIDDHQIIYVGTLNDEQKNHYLGISKAFIFPIQWNEPFGIVMIEAMACGTPVIGFNAGSVGEVIDEGITGFKVSGIEEMAEAVKNVGIIDRKKCGEHAKRRFDASIIAAAYLQMAGIGKKSVVIVTTGQPAANPRALKEYHALKQSGYPVKVLYTYSAEWSHRIDQQKFSNGELDQNDFILVGGNPYNKKVAYFLSRLYFKIANKVERLVPSRLLKEITIARSALYLKIYAQKYKADIYIAHYLGALPAAVKAAAKNDAAVIFDAEDFHRGEDPYYPSQIKNVTEIEDRLLPKVNLITTASPLISEAYQQLYPTQKVVTINNVFSLQHLQPVKDNTVGELKLFWFSQNIGPNRGLETIIAALNEATENISLSLLGNVRDNRYVQKILQQSKRPEKIHIIDPVDPEKIFEIAGNFDIGLAAEIPYCINRDICLTNKIFTYLLAGNCVFASNTSAQKKFMDTYPGIGSLYKYDDAAGLSRLIKKFNSDRNLLLACKKNSLNLADQTLNWETESNKLIGIMESI